MANVNGKKYALTALFPIKDGEHYAELKAYLREMEKDDYGSPLSQVACVHMARFVIIEDFYYQGLPAKRDHLQSRYLLFMCDFDGESVDVLAGAMASQIGGTVFAIWRHCVGFPAKYSRDQLIAYFERCQLKTSLFFADRPDDEVARILRALMYKRAFVEFVEKGQRLPRGQLKAEFDKMWSGLASQPSPHPGSM